MASSIPLLLGLLVGLALGAGVGVLIARTRVQLAGCGHEDPEVVRARHDAELAALRHESEVRLADLRHDAAQEHARVERELAAARADVEARLAAALAEATQLRAQVTAAQEQYRDVVERQRREAKERESAAQAESRVLQQLAPVAKQLGDMRQKVEQIERQRSEQHGQLAEQLRVTHETAAQSKRAAETLASALRNNSERGAYGETQLRTLVESAGLLNRIDFTTQESITADSGARRPDMVINLPGGKRLAIDAKVPYRAFIDAYREELDDSRRKQLRVEHARAVKAHVDALASKQYWTGLDVSPEFTIAFIPNEAILNDALEADPGLMEHAYGRGIALATPVNLWAVLKTVALTWKQEQMAENARDLVALGRELYKRLGTLSDHVGKLGRSLERTVGDYNKFVGSLERQVLSTARKLDAVDEAAQLGRVAELEEVEPRRLSASELTETVAVAAPVAEARPAVAEARPAEDAGEEFSLFDDLDRPEIDPAVVEGRPGAQEQTG